MSYLTFDWLFGKSVAQAHRPVAGISEPTGLHVACTESKTQKITISGEDCEVTAHKTGKATWKAYGYVKGMPIQTAADTAHAAFSRWRHLAKTMLDG